MPESDTPADKVEHNLVQWVQVSLLGLVLSQVGQSIAVQICGVAVALFGFGVFFKRARSWKASGVPA